MNKNVMLGLGAVALVGLGFLLSDYMRLRGEVAAGDQAQASAMQQDQAQAPSAPPTSSASPTPTPTVAAPPPPPPATQSFNAGYANHPASRYTGTPKPLQLTANQRTFRTRLTDAYRAPIDYGGSLTIAQIGCGTGCRFVYALDKSSGKVIEFPLGGERTPYLWIRYRPDSALIWATWEDSYPSDCKAQPWKLGAGGFSALARPSSINCDLARDTP